VTTFTQARVAVFQRLLAAWGSPTTIQLEDEPFQPTQGVNWLRVRIGDLPSVMNALGGPGNREIQRRAAVYASVSVPAGTGGSAAALDLAYTLATALECSSFGGLDFMEPVSLVPLRSQDGMWYTVTIVAPFVYYDLR
jgi:hypothetical protein